MPVAATFDLRDENGASLSDVARIDTMVTVVDAVNLLKDYSSHDFLKDRGEVIGEEDDRTLVHLLTDQIEFADVVVVLGRRTGRPDIGPLDEGCLAVFVCPPVLVAKIEIVHEASRAAAG